MSRVYHVNRFDQRRLLRINLAIVYALASVTYKVLYQRGFHLCVVGKVFRRRVTTSVKDSSLVALGHITLCPLPTPVDLLGVLNAKRVFAFLYITYG